MKRLLVVIFLLPVITYGQDHLPEKEGRVMYEEIDSIPGVNKTELYNRSKAWFAKTFNSAKDVIQLDDKESGQIIGKGSFRYLVTVLLTSAEWSGRYTIQVDCRDNKIRIRIQDINCEGSMSSMSAEQLNQHPRQTKAHIKAINSNCVALLSDFKSAINKSSTDNF